MKLRTAVETMLSDADTSMSSKVEIIQFLRRYSQPKRPITHYSCRGKSTVALKKFLEMMGMTDKDFTIVSSSFDPEFNQIRWAQNLSKISELVASVANSTGQSPAFFDELYVKVATKGDFRNLTSVFTDTEDGSKVVIAPKPLDSKHIAVQVMKRTKDIVTSMALEFPDRTAAGSPAGPHKKVMKNAEIAINSAMEFLGRNFNLGTGEKISEDAPYILPLSVLEVYARYMLGVPGPQGLREDTLVFKTTPMATDLFRLVRKSEELMWNACLNAPIEYLWNLKGEENALKGYFFRTDEAVEKADLDNKIGIFIGGNAALIHDEGAEDNITPAMCVSNHIEFWEYVLSIYRAAYSCDAGLSCQCRIGVPIALPVWNTSHFPDSCSECIDSHETEWQRMHPESKNKSPIIAEYGVFLGKSVDNSFTDVHTFIEDSPPFKVTVLNGSSKTPDFTKGYLTKEELAWEWYAMTHLDEDAGGIKQFSRVYERIHDEMHEKEAILHFKSIISSADPDYLAKMSSCAHNSRFSPKSTENGTARYTALAAFIESAVVGLRKAWSQDGTSSIPFKTRPDDSRSVAHLITNVYSGVYTDMSPMVGSDSDDGSVFPCPMTAHSSKIISALHDTGEQMEQFTKFLDRMALAKTTEQVCFAKRTTSTLRQYTLILETNIDADKFLGHSPDTSTSVDTSGLTTVLGTAFLQTIVLNRNDPACSFDDDAIRNSVGCIRTRNHDVMMRLCNEFFPKMFPGRSDYRLPAGAYVRNDTLNKNMFITARKDKYGRLIIIFVCSGDIAAYAKLAYRFRCCMPLATASIKEKTFSGFSGLDFAITESDWSSIKMADTVIQRHMIERATDYNGCGASRPSGENGDAGPLFRGPMEDISPKYAPSRRWFLNNSTRIICSCVFNSF